MAVPTHTDILVGGGGPAGLALAIAARQRGFRVTVADPARPPIDKACGEGLNPEGRRALERLGVGLDTAPCQPFRGIRFLENGLAVHADFPAGPALGIRRTLLHHAMARRAGETGVNLRWGSRIDAAGPGHAVIDGRRVSCRWLVGADGGNSRIRRWAGLDAGAAVHRRFGFRRHYRVAPWTDYMELYWCRGCQFYVTPVSPSEICVAVISTDRELRLDAALERCPALGARLEGVGVATFERGAVSGSCRLRRVHRGSIALVGDASGYVDAITGEGLRLAFEQAFELAACLEREDLEDYQIAHRRIRRRPALMAQALLSIAGRDRLRGRVLRALASEPGLFARMLAMHAGALPAFRFAPAALVLGRRMLGF